MNKLRLNIPPALAWHKIRPESFIVLVAMVQLGSFFGKLKTGALIYWAFYASSSLVLVILIIQNHKIRIRTLAALLAILCLLLFFSQFSRSYPAENSVALVYVGLASFATGYALSRSEKGYVFALQTFYLYCIFLLISLFKSNFDVEAYNLILYGASRNMLSAILILLSIFVFASFYHARQILPLHVFVISVGLCVMLYGRTGILLSTLLLVYAFYYRWGVKGLGLIAMAPLVFVVIDPTQLMSAIESMTNFKRGLSTERLRMVAEYYYNFNLYDLFFGRDLRECCGYITEFQSNPHNSFLMAHLRYGIVAWLLFFIYFYRIIQARSATLLFLAVMITLRYSVDQIGWFSPYDFVLFYIYFIARAQHRGIRSKDFGSLEIKG